MPRFAAPQCFSLLRLLQWHEPKQVFLRAPRVRQLSAQHQCTIPFDPDISLDPEKQPPASAMIHLRGPLRSKLICVESFGGVRRGRKLRYALVEGSGRKVIVKINDVGPLAPGRVIDLNRQTMRYFDPSLQRGLIPNVKVTAYRPGPVGKSRVNRLRCLMRDGNVALDGSVDRPAARVMLCAGNG